MVTKFNYTGDDVLDVMSKYAVNRNNSVASLITKHFGLETPAQPVKLLELGAGRGEFINRYVGKPNIQTYATDLDEGYLRGLSQRHIVYRDLQNLGDSVNYIFAIDVLEHIEDDVAVLKQIYQALLPGGKILVYVPARMELYSAFDKQIGHFRRYDPQEMRDKVISVGFSINTLRYHDFLGYFAAYYNKLFFKTGDSLNAKAVKVYDTWLVPVSTFIERLMVKPFIGKDLLLVASKTK